MGAVFISYRRDDSQGESRHLYDDLTRRFGGERVFMDVAGIEPGLDFRSVINDRVSSCTVLLAVIGQGWLTVKDESGLRRLDSNTDYVRLETASALKKGVRVIPVLVHGTRMPKFEELPEGLKDLAYRNAFELTLNRWDSDVDLLIKHLERDVAETTSAPIESKNVNQSPGIAPNTIEPPVFVSPVKRGWRRTLGVGLALAALAICVGAGWYLWPSPQPAPVPAPQSKRPIRTAYTVPVGTPVVVRMAQTVSAMNNVGDSFTGTLAQSMVVMGFTFIKAAAPVIGRVTASKGQGTFKGSGALAVAITKIGTYPVSTSAYEIPFKGKSKRIAAGEGPFVGGSAAGGPLIGGLLGSGSGTAGAAYPGSNQISIPAESVVTFTLTAPLTVYE